MALQHLRSSTANKRPIPTQLSAGQIAVNTNEASPGLFFKDSNGDLVKIGPVHVGTSAPNSSPASTAATALVSGTVYQILTVGNTDFTAVGASANTVGVVFTATGAGTGTGTVSGQQGNEKGEQWLDTTGGAYDLKIYDGSAWRSQAGEFVNHTGDTMTGVLQFVSGSASAPGIAFSGDTNTGIYRPGADSVAVTTGGTQRITVDSSGRVGIAQSTFADARESLIVGSVSGQSSTFQIIKSSSTNGNAALYFGDPDNNYRGGVIYGNSNDALSFRSAGNDAMRIDSSGRVLVGTSSARGGFDNSSVVKSDLQVEGVGSAANANRTAISIVNNGSADADSAGLYLARSGGTSVGSFTAVTANDVLARITFSGADGSEFVQAASIEGVIDGTPGANDMPGRLVFSTTADGASSPTERMRIDSSGNVGIGRTPFTSAAGYPLQLRGSSTQTFLHLSTATHGDTNDDGMVIGADNSNAYIVQRENNPLVFYTNNTERMRIDSSGNVGIGRTSPAQNLDVASSSNIAYALDGWALAGKGDASDILFGGILTSQFDTLRLYTGGSERMRLDSNGHILINTTTDIATGYVQHLKMDSGTGGIAIQNYGSSNTALVFRNSTNDNNVGFITTSNTTTTYGTSSDYRLKENVVDIADGITRVKQLQPRRFNFIADADTTVDGFLAHEAQAVVPEAVTGTHNEVDDDGNPVYQGIDQSKLVPLLTAALQEAIAKIETLEAKVAALEAQ